MANKMLIDATHPEETRVVVVRGNRVEEFDFESASRKQLRGNIYLAKVTRVEPSLQAAFIEYGGNRHGFLAFSEIHPDYYQIPVADRQALIDEEERAERAADAEVDRRAGGHRRRRERGAHRRDEVKRSDELAGEEGVHGDAGVPAGDTAPDGPHGDASSVAETHAPETSTVNPDESAQDNRPEHREVGGSEAGTAGLADGETHDDSKAAAPAEKSGGGSDRGPALSTTAESADESSNGETLSHARSEEDAAERPNGNDSGNGEIDEEDVVESLGGDDAIEEVHDRMPRLRRQYKIQEVIKRRQIMLVQVVKEERGTKGAALTTYLSLAGRYSVLMPNTARGGGISRKITSADDRKRLKQIAQDLEVPEGMGVILRTAGANRTKTEVKRDFEYLLRLWETVRDVTLKSTAPKLVYEEGSLVKRSIRDLYSKDIDEVVVAGDDAYRDAKDFMRMLMPSHAKNVKPYKDTQPLFTRYGVESQLDAMFSPTVQLKSGGYVVLNQTEALVSIDVNSGRATREHHIEDTALKTNLEASEEIARQLRLRDLAGLIVIDFIDMDEKRNNRSVERRLKEALKNDRARIQVGRISHFGLLEMSRQRIRSSVLESSTETCTQCGGTGHVRSVASVALQLVRSLEEMLIKGATHNLIVRTRADVALYVLNHKRALLRDLEHRFGVMLTVNADATVSGQLPFVIDRGEQVQTLEAAKARIVQPAPLPVPDPEEEAEEADEADEGDVDEGEATGDEIPPETEHALEGAPEGDRASETDAGRRRRRRRRGRRGEPREDGPFTREAVAEHAPPLGEDDDAAAAAEPADFRPVAGESREEGERRRRRRGRRGGRRSRREFEGEPLGGEQRPTGDSPQALGEAATDSPGAPVPQDFERSVAPEPEPFVESRAPKTAQEPPATPAVEPAPEKSRRRSTVREPVPFVIGTGEAPVAPPLPQAEPVPEQPRPTPQALAPESAAAAEPSDQAAQPRRGWWSRRFGSRA
jgi:ribonuclease E